MKLKTTTRKSNLFDYRHAYILVKRTITVAANIVAAASDVSNINITFKNCTPFTDFFTKINNTKANNVKDLHIAMLKYNLVKYIENCSTTCENLQQHCKDEPNDGITESESFTFKSKFTNDNNNADTVDVEELVPLKYLNNFWITIGMLLINCEKNIILIESVKCVISDTPGGATFTITDTKLYFIELILSIQDNSKLLK